MTVVVTKRQLEVLDYLRTYSEREGVAPTYAEIADNFGWRSPGTVAYVIDELVKRGAVRRVPRVRRGLEVVGQMVRVVCPGCGGDDALCFLCEGTGKLMAARA